MRRLAGFLGQAGVQVQQVIHSGKTRAEQTAAMLAEALLANGQPLAHAGLSPNDPVETVAAEIEQWSGDTMIVGHPPFVSRLASYLLGADADQPIAAFRPGSMVCQEQDAEGRWVLVWMIGAELFVSDSASN